MFEVEQSRRTIIISTLEKGPACDIRHRFALSAVYDMPCRRNVHLGCAASHQLAGFDNLSGAERIPFDDLGLRRYGELRHSTRRESRPSQLHRAARLRSGYADGGAMVQSRGIHAPGCIHVRQRRPKHGVWARACKRSTLASAASSHDQRTDKVRNPRRVLQRSQSRESRHAQPLRQHAPVRTITEAATPGREIQVSARLSF